MSWGTSVLWPGGLARHADDVHVVLDRVAGDLGRRLEQRADVDVEAEVGERGGDDLGAAVVAVLAHLHHEHAGAATLGGGEGLDVVLDAPRSPRRPRRPSRTRRRCVRISARWRPNTVFHGVGDLADRGPGPGRLDAQRQQVAVAAGALGERVERRRARGVVAVGAHLLELGDLLLAHLGVVDVEHVDHARGARARYLLTPTTTSSPRSTRAWRRAADSSMRSFGMPDSTALVMPPSSSTSSMSAQALSARSSVSDST